MNELRSKVSPEARESWNNAMPFEDQSVVENEGPTPIILGRPTLQNI
jgi:hypothetical protein